MEFCEVLSRKRQDEFWKMYFAEIEKMGAHPDSPEEENESIFEKASVLTWQKFKEKYKHDLNYSEHWAFLGEEASNPSSCSACGEHQVKSLYYGVSLNICLDQECLNADGFWSFILYFIQDNEYAPYVGSYWKALWHWFFSDLEVKK